jgi:hypothetical protein
MNQTGQSRQVRGTAFGLFWPKRRWPGQVSEVTDKNLVLLARVYIKKKDGIKKIKTAQDKQINRGV